MTNAVASDLRVGLDGTPFDAAAVIGLRLTRTSNAPATLSLRFDLTGRDLSGIPSIGSMLTLDGPGTAGRLFEGSILRRNIEHGQDEHTVDVTAFDRLAALRETQSGGVEVIDSIHAFARGIAGRAGLALVSRCTDFAAGRHLHRFEDDLAFLVETAGRYGLGLFCKGGDLHLFAPGEAPSQRHDIADRASRFRLVEEPRHASPTRLIGWSAQTDHAISARPAALAAVPRGAMGMPVRPNEPADLLLAAIDRRHAAEARWSEAEAIGLVDAWPGDELADPYGGAPLVLSWIEIAADGAKGIVTRLGSRPAPAPPAQATAVLTGVVERVGDPEHAGRVCVALHGYDGALTGWLPTAAPGGGGRTGFSASLGVGDPAVVIAPGGDPECGLVLGGILRAGGPQTDGFSGESRTRMTWRGDGLTLVLDEVAKSIGLRIDDGGAIDIGPDSIRLKAARHIELATDGDIQIRGRRVDFLEA
ncbi:MAG: hypothetical protein KF914_17380 [Rhizobiaceae bacterium]|nr:hypothetical protein [Rhizobiaceae bacterium]